METAENLEGLESRAASRAFATQWTTSKNSLSSASLNGSEDQSEDEGPPEAQNSQFELDRHQRNIVDFVCKISSDISEEAERKFVTPGEEHSKSGAQPRQTDNVDAEGEEAEAEPPSAAPSSEQEAPHRYLPRIVKHKPGSITFWDCSIALAAGSGPFVNDSSDECSAGEEKRGDNPDCGDDDDGDVFEELPRGREPPVTQRARDRQRRRGTARAGTGRRCGYEAEEESSSKEVMLPFGIQNFEATHFRISLLNSSFKTHLLFLLYHLSVYFSESIQTKK